MWLVVCAELANLSLQAAQRLTETKRALESMLGEDVNSNRVRRASPRSSATNPQQRSGSVSDEQLPADIEEEADEGNADEHEYECAEVSANSAHT